VTARAVWDDGQDVSVPGNVLAAFEAAWWGVQRWNIAQQYPDPLHDDPGFLDHVEQALAEEVVRGATKAGRALLTSSGPVWTVRPLYAEIGEQVGFAVAADGFAWQRGTPLPYQHQRVWLMCRMSGLSIPLLPNEVTT
jgi:hypothetical protein